MSGKYNKKKSNKRKKNNIGIWIALVLCGIALCAGIWFIATRESELDQHEVPETTTAPVMETTIPTENATQAETENLTEAPTSDVQIDNVEPVGYDLCQGLQIMDVGKYTGIYMEDGSDEVVSGVLMVVLTNNGENDLEYAEIILTTDSGEAKFSASTLPVGASVVLLEQNRMAYTDDMQISDISVQNVAFFDAPLTLSEDIVKIQILDGAFNVINISGEDITGDIVICYKNSSSDMFYGGISYRIRISGGMKADEVKQIMSDHFSSKGSTIMFVKCG